jgi:mannose-6-phosphate isomerase
MDALQHPLRFTPYFRPAPWGGRALARFHGKNLPTDEPYGESWEVSDHPTHRSVLAAGGPPGRTLRDLMATRREELLGPAAAAHAIFPWLIKFLDVRDWLSVQVHPSPEVVRTLLPGEGAKTEAWLVLDATADSRVYAGLKPGVGPRELRDALARGAAAECLHCFTPRAGDVIFLPAGTVHAGGGGLLLAEVQQTSDATFRLYDWDRRDARGNARPLHVEESFASIDWAQGPVRPINTAERLQAGTTGDRVPLLDCSYFRWDYVATERPFEVGGTGRLQALIVVKGRGHLADDESFAAGDVFLLPACLAVTRVRPATRVAAVVCSLP